MASCLKRHVLSMLTRGDIELSPHSLYRFRASRIQEELEAKDFEIRDVINELMAEGRVELVKEYLALACPACGSPDPISKLNCPRCGSAELEVSGERFVCRSCGASGPIHDALLFKCKTCGKSFTLQEAGHVALGRIRLIGQAASLELIAGQLLKAGAIYTRCARVKGKSGYTHQFDFYVRGKGGEVYIDVVQEDGGVKLGALFEFLTKVYDAGVQSSIFVAIPGLSVKVDPGVKWARVIEAGGIEEAAHAILNEIKEIGIIAK